MVSWVVKYARETYGKIGHRLALVDCRASMVGFYGKNRFVHIISESRGLYARLREFFKIGPARNAGTDSQNTTYFDIKDVRGGTGVNSRVVIRD